MYTAKKIFFTLVLLLCISIVGQAQTISAEAKADERIAVINDEIKSVDSELALTSEQMSTIKELHIKRTEEIRAAKKSDLSDEEKKAKTDAAIKVFNQTLSKEVLNKAQVKARRDAKKTSEY